MMDKIDLEVIRKHEIIFFKKSKVYVIISGSILMKNHEKETEMPDTLAKFGEGDILNFMQEKSTIFNSIETWFVAQVETEVAIFDKTYFQQVWNMDLMTEKLLLKRSIIQSHYLFAHLSDLTIMTLVSELFQQKEFYNKEIIMMQSQYSPTNSEFRKYYSVQEVNKFAEKIKSKNLQTRRLTTRESVAHKSRVESVK